jgi:mRNA interferase MazF
MAPEYRRGQVWSAGLDPVVGHEQAGRRPVLVVQNDIGNRFSPTVIVAAITTRLPSRTYPTEVRVEAGAGGLPRDSAVRLDQIRTVDKTRLTRHLGLLDDATMRQVDRALEISLGLVPL